MQMIQKEDILEKSKTSDSNDELEMFDHFKWQHIYIYKKKQGRLNKPNQAFTGAQGCHVLAAFQPRQPHEKDLKLPKKER